MGFKGSEVQILSSRPRQKDTPEGRKTKLYDPHLLTLRSFKNRFPKAFNEAPAKAVERAKQGIIAKESHHIKVLPWLSR